MVACFCSIVSSKSVGESLNLISVQLFAAAVRLPYRDTAMPCYCHAMDGWCARRLLLPACRRPQVFCWIEPLTCRAADQILVSAPNSCRPRAIRRVTSLASEQPGRFRLAQFLLSKKGAHLETQKPLVAHRLPRLGSLSINFRPPHTYMRYSCRAAGRGRPRQGAQNTTQHLGSQAFVVRLLLMILRSDPPFRLKERRKRLFSITEGIALGDSRNPLSDKVETPARRGASRSPAALGCGLLARHHWD